MWQILIAFYNPVRYGSIYVRMYGDMLLHCVLRESRIADTHADTELSIVPTCSATMHAYSARIHLFLFCFQTRFLSHLVRTCSQCVFAASCIDRHISTESIAMRVSVVVVVLFHSFSSFFADYGDLQLHRRPAWKRCS